MTHAHISAGIVAVISGTSSAIMQATVPSQSYSILLVPAISALVGGGIAYGVIKTSVDALQRSMEKMEDNIGHIYGLMRDQAKSISKIEGQLEQ